MTLDEFYKTYSSDSTAGSANQTLTADDGPVTRRGRIWFRLAHGGKNYSLLFSNRTDSTFADGTNSKANDCAGDYDILSLRVGLTEGRDAEPKLWHTASFEGSPVRHVPASETEPFFTDPIPLDAPADSWMCYEIEVRGARYPYHEELVLTIQMQREDGGWAPGRKIPVPLMIGSDRPVSRRIGFLGDSITQGCGTAYDSWTHWAAKIAGGLDPAYSVWDLGIGYARAYDAATDGGWLARAKRCGAVNVCLGVNDLCRGRNAEQISADLCRIVRLLKEAGCRVILFTVPPFDFGGDAKTWWYEINRYLRETLSKEADALFDFAAVLGRPAPDEHLSVYGGHPNAEGCAVAAKAYLAQGLPGIVFEK